MRLGTEANAPLPSSSPPSVKDRQRGCEPQTVPSGQTGNFPRLATTSVEHPETTNLVLRDLVRLFEP